MQTDFSKQPTSPLSAAKGPIDFRYLTTSLTTG
jgi:hypothetical protein